MSGSTVLVALGLIALGALLWPRRRRPLNAEALKKALATPLARELWRQESTPPHATSPDTLAPILAFDLYSGPMRRLYDRSRAMDGRMLRALVARPDDVDLQASIRAQQTATREVRRRLMGVLMGLEDSGAPLDDLDRALDAVNEALRRL